MNKDYRFHRVGEDYWEPWTTAREDYYAVSTVDGTPLGVLTRAWNHLGGSGWSTPGASFLLGKTREAAARELHCQWLKLKTETD